MTDHIIYGDNECQKKRILEDWFNVELYVTNICNLHCTYCIMGDYVHTDTHITIDDQFITDFIIFLKKQNSIGYIVTINGGEPTCTDMTSKLITRLSMSFTNIEYVLFTNFTAPAEYYINLNYTNKIYMIATYHHRIDTTPISEIITKYKILQPLFMYIDMNTIDSTSAVSDAFEIENITLSKNKLVTPDSISSNICFRGLLCYQRYAVYSNGNIYNCNGELNNIYNAGELMRHKLCTSDTCKEPWDESPKMNITTFINYKKREINNENKLQ